MDSDTLQARRDSVQERVRKAAPATLIGAVLMLYFGFVHLARPDGVDVFHRAALVLYYTLRIGGIALGVTTLLLYVGRPVALVIDAVLAIPAGAIIAICGLLMLLDNGEALNSVILIFCGGSFVSSGFHNAREYWRIGRRDLQ